MPARGGPLLPLLTRDPSGGHELIVTRLECRETGIVIEGNFSRGWIGRLTPQQLEFVGMFLRNRGNVQKLASELNMSYNTARNRLDDIVAALGGVPEETGIDRAEILAQLAAGEIDPQEAARRLRGE